MTTRNKQGEVCWKIEPYNAVEVARWHYAFQQIFEELKAMDKKEGCVSSDKLTTTKSDTH